VHAATDAGRRRRPRRAAGRLFAVAGFFLVVATIWLAPLIGGFGTRLLGEPNDGSSTLRDAWAAQAQGETVFTWTRDELAVAPEGTPRSRAVAVANGLYPAAVLVLEPVLGLIGTWNVLLILGFVATAVAMFALLERLGLGPLPSLFGAYAAAFNAFAFEKALFGQAAYVHIWVFPLLIIALLRMRERQTVGAAILAGLVLVAAFYTQSYFGLLALLVFLVFVAVQLVLREETPRSRGSVVALGATAAATAAVAFTPALVYWASERERVALAVSRSVEDLTALGAGLSAYLLPSGRHPLLGGAGAHSAQSTEGEPTLFFGYSTLLLAAAAVVLLVRRHPGLVQHGTRRFTAWLAVVLVPLAFVCSLPREVTLLGVAVPMPSHVVGEVLPYWRVYARFGLLVGLGLAILAAIALNVVARTARGRVFAGVAIAVLAFELAPGPSVPTWAADESPPYARWLAEHPGGTVAMYPQAETPNTFLYLMNREYARQRFHGHPLYDLSGGGWTGTRAEAIRILTRNPEDELTPGVLAAQGVRYIVLRHDGYELSGSPVPPLPRDGYRLAARVPKADIYEVRAKPVDLAATLNANLRRIGLARALPQPTIQFASGFHPPESGANGRHARWLIQGGRLVADNTGPDGLFYLSASMLANGRPRTVVVDDADGHELGRGRAAPFAQPVTVGPIRLPAGRSTIVVRAIPGPESLGAGDSRYATILVSDLELVPLGDFALR
jgi:hypothetical protein